MAITLADLLDTLTADGAKSMFVDEITHTGKAGTTLVERWPLAGIGSTFYGARMVQDADGPWAWRLMHRPATARKHRHYGYNVAPTRIAYGVADSEAEAATLGRAEARRLAKLRRVQVAASCNCPEDGWWDLPCGRAGHEVSDVLKDGRGHWAVDQADQPPPPY